MRTVWMGALVLALLVAPAVPVSVELAVTSKVALKGDLEDLIAFGLLKEMTCDSHGNIFSPSNRKYGDAISAIVRFPHDAASYKTFRSMDFPIWIMAPSLISIWSPMVISMCWPAKY